MKGLQNVQSALWYGFGMSGNQFYCTRCTYLIFLWLSAILRNNPVNVDNSVVLHNDVVTVANLAFIDIIGSCSLHWIVLGSVFLSLGHMGRTSKYSDVRWNGCVDRGWK